VLFFDFIEENSTSKITAASSYGIIKDKSKSIDEETTKKFKKDNKTA